jgi:chitinase
VSDGRLTSAPSIVTVTATANRPPVANAVMITSVTDRAVGKLLTLDGSGSNDPDGDRIVSYTWTVLKAPTGSSAQLLGSNAVRPLLIPDVAGLYVLSLIVSDGNLSSSPAIVSFEVAP